MDEILARAGIFHAHEPDVASALTIRMHKFDSLRTDTTTKQRPQDSIRNRPKKFRLTLTSRMSSRAQ